MIPEKAVGAAAEIAFKRNGAKYHFPATVWDDLEPRFRTPWIEDARLILEAAAPYLRAEGWDAYESAPFEIRLTEDGKSWEPFKINPYRSQT